MIAQHKRIQESSQHMPIATVRLDDGQAAWVESQTTRYRKKADVIRDLIDAARSGLTASAILGKPSAETAAKPEQEKVLPLDSSTTKESINKRSIKSVPPSLTAHEDLIRAFWKTKQGSKSDAGWKLLMTELQKIQDKYSDRVVRDQLELAAANRWKGVSLKNYEQFGLSAQKRATGSTFDWDSINGVSI